MFEDWYAEQTAQNIDALITVPEEVEPYVYCVQSH